MTLSEQKSFQSHCPSTEADIFPLQRRETVQVPIGLINRLSQLPLTTRDIRHNNNDTEIQDDALQAEMNGTFLVELWSPWRLKHSAVYEDDEEPENVATVRGCALPTRVVKVHTRARHRYVPGSDMDDTEQRLNTMAYGLQEGQSSKRLFMEYLVWMALWHVRTLSPYPKYKD